MGHEHEGRPDLAMDARELGLHRFAQFEVKGAERLVEQQHGGLLRQGPGEGDSLLLLLDARGVEVSTGSACSAGVARPSHVLLAMGADEDSARSSLRFSLGHTSTAADVDALVEVLPAVVERARRAVLR